MTLHEYLREARERLIAAGIPRGEAVLDAELLARHVLGWDRVALVARLRDQAPGSFAADYATCVDRRAAREPLAYITGVQEFWGRQFRVGPGVLIPRPETELIIEEALSWAGARAAGAAPLRVLDIGTGSGCLAVTLALEIPGAQVAATDVSSAALAIARANADRLGAAIDVRLGNDLADLAGSFDLIVSNPPYVAAPAHAGLAPEVRDHEPVEALVAGAEGLDVIQEIVRKAGPALAPAGLLLMEIGYDQAAAVTRIVGETEGLRLLRVREDLQGIPRVAVIASARPGAASSG
ncbi:MAG: peptide chain release factor N(5)-glutamine methyltransferase [Vicinamibacterales bacterium]